MHAFRRRRLIRRLLLSLAVVLVPLAMIVGVSRRIIALDKDPRIGPINWKAVLSSEKTIAVLWDLFWGSDPTLYWDVSCPSGLPQIVGGSPKDITVSVVLPRNGGSDVPISIQITNQTNHALVCPPIDMAQADGLGGIPEWTVYCPPVLYGQSTISLGPILGPGVRLLRPGEAITMHVNQPAEQREVGTCRIIVVLHGSRHEFIVFPNFNIQRRSDWRDVGPTDVVSYQFYPGAVLPEPLNEQLDPPSCCIDEWLHREDKRQLLYAATAHEHSGR